MLRKPHTNPSNFFLGRPPPKKIILWVQCKPGSRKFSIIVMLSTKKKNKTKQQDINTTTPTTTTITGRTEVTEKWSYSLCLENGWTYAWLGWPRKMAFPSSEGDVKIVSSNIALVLNTLTLKYSAFVRDSYNKRRTSNIRNCGGPLNTTPNFYHREWPPWLEIMQS